MILKNIYWLTLILLGVMLLAACSPGAPASTPGTPTQGNPSEPTRTAEPLSVKNTPTPSPKPATATMDSSPSPAHTPSEMPAPQVAQAAVISVKVNGEPGGYSFSVTVSSPDEGCSQYADWWEVISQDGELVYRRVLLHSHVNEQPFTRSGGPVSIAADAAVLVRVHMNNSGYSSLAMEGSPEQGFAPIELSPGFAAELSEQQPLPGDCGF